MCRIAGIISPQHTRLQEHVLQMRDAMQHGGPDGAGVFVDAAKGIALGHRRLSLLDLSTAGAQPMQDATARYQLVFNGELYNYAELKEELLALGYHFRSNSDTEVVLYAFIAWGTEAFHRFNAMFALAIYDTYTGILTLARDAVGIKPLYYHQAANRFLFASELRAFKALDAHWPLQKNWSIYFLAFGFIPEPFTQLQNIYALVPGSYMQINAKAQCVNTASFVHETKKISITQEAAAIAAIRSSLTVAVQRQLVADAPLGVFLSGGVDSSILTAIASKYKQPLQTLSIAFEQGSFSEAPYQEAVAQAYQTQHKAYTLSTDLFYEQLADIQAAMDQPSNDGVNTYFISKYAHESGLKTVLSGLGADELFGGYPSFKHAHRVNVLSHLPFFTIQLLQSVLSADKWKRLSYLYEKRANNYYLVNRGIFAPDQIASILSCSLQEVRDALHELKDIKIDASATLLEQNARREFSIYMRNQLLRDADVMSMWHGLEIRVPFLDQAFIHTVNSIDPALLFQPKKGKHLLIKAFQDAIPKAVWDRAKQGFTFPFQTWMQSMDFKNDKVQTHSYYEAFRKQQLHWSKLWVLEQLG
jgi:asparagine synthase (glutamine-hydrolysing)